MKNNTKQLTDSSASGVSMVEVLVGIAIFLVLMTVLLSTFLMYLRIATGGPDRLTAGYLMYEGVEALRTIRDQGWDEHIDPLETGEEYYLIFESENGWSLTGVPQPLIDEKFQRKILAEPVYRDGDDNIATSATGVEDPDSRHFTIQVEWVGLFGQAGREGVTYLMNPEVGQ